MEYLINLKSIKVSLLSGKGNNMRISPRENDWVLQERLTAAQRISGWNESASEREILSMSQKNRLLWRLIPLFGGQKESAVMKELFHRCCKRFLPDKSSIIAVERRLEQTEEMKRSWRTQGCRRHESWRCYTVDHEPLGRNCRRTLLTQLTDRFFGWKLETCYRVEMILIPWVHNWEVETGG